MEEQVRGLFFTGNFAKAASMAKSPTPDILIWQMRAALESKQAPVQSIPAVASFPAANFQALCDFLRGRATTAEVTADSLGFAEVVKAYELAVAEKWSQVVETLPPSTVERQALVVLALLKLNRPDIAEQLVKKAAAASDEEAVLQLAQVWLALSKTEPDEAGSILSELESKFGASALLLTAKGVAMMQEGNYAEAEQVLTQAVAKGLSDLSQSKSVACAVANLVTCKRLLGEGVEETEAQLGALWPDHPYFALKTTAAVMFDKALE